VRASRAEHLLLAGLAAAVPPLGMTLFDWPATSSAALLALATLARPARRVLGFRAPRELLPALGETARAVALYGVLLAVGLALG
jgi:1,4-dihydroxy-2-naphthoate octaprenyltransferase